MNSLEALGARTLLTASFLATAVIASTFAADPVPVDQGPTWTPAKRELFYTLDQGSKIIPLRWITALRLPDGRSFMDDGLGRYGYLSNAANPKLPIGFTAAGAAGEEVLGMTCAACVSTLVSWSRATTAGDS